MKPRAFVLMPFTPEFDDIYKYLIKDSLETAGFEVIRADDLISQNNILKDIIESIVSSDLIVADLSESNPNVYYELGVSHALNKPVILLTQDISELPFDLRAYRVISYQTHFSKMDSAKAELIALGREALAGKVPFGSPVSDFTNFHPPTLELNNSESNTSESQKDNLGFLDYMVNLEDGFELLGLIVTSVGEELNKTTPKIENTTKTLNTGNASSTKQKRDAVRKLASHLENFGLFLKPKNESYREKLKEVEKSLDYLLSGDVNHDDDKSLDEFIATLDSVETAAYSGRITFMELVKSMNEMPNLETNFDKSKKFMSQELRLFISNIDQTISVISRAKVAGKNLTNKNKQDQT